MVKVHVVHPKIPVVVTSLNLAADSSVSEVESVFKEYGDLINKAQALGTPTVTGELSTGNNYSVDKSGSSVSLTFANDVPYSRFVEFGTGMAGAMAPPDFIPDGLVWRYGDITGVTSRAFFYPPILNYEQDIKFSLGDNIQKMLKSEVK